MGVLKNKFVVLGVPRVGSNFFISKLNLHPEVLCHYEIFHREQIYTGFPDKEISDRHLEDLAIRDHDPNAFLQKVWATNYNFPTVGYNIFPEQNEPILHQSLLDASQKKIILKRKDLLRNFLSRRIAAKTGIWSSRDAKKKNPAVSDKRIDFNPDEFSAHTEAYFRFYNYVETECALQQQNYLVIYYEDILENPRKCFKEIFEFLDIDSSIDVVRSTGFQIQNPETINELVTNPDNISDFQKSGLFFERYKEPEVARLRKDLSKLEFALQGAQHLAWQCSRMYSQSLRQSPLKKYKLYKEVGMVTSGLRKRNNEFRQHPQPKLNLSNALGIYPSKAHRSGWNYALSQLEPLHNPGGYLLDGYVEKSFFWDKKSGTPYTLPWVGFVHFPPKIPDWHPAKKFSTEGLLNNPKFRQSLPFCKGLYVLSDYHAKILRGKVDVEVEVALHPTEFPELQWSFDKFNSNPQKKLIQVGFFLRSLNAIYRVKTKLERVLLKAYNSEFNNILQLEQRELLQSVDLDKDNVETLEMVDTVTYDKLLSENIILSYLYDASANNTVIECIARTTPIVINPIPPVVEYLGIDYPLYYNQFSEIPTLIEDIEKVKDAHIYLKNLPTRKRITGESFCNSIKESRIYRDL